MSEVRTRFAPSPTGYLHIGGLRNALYSYVYAHQHGGKYVLRIEDTDQTRFVEGAVESLIRVLETTGLKADEGPAISQTPTKIYQDPRYSHLTENGPYGPYIQSERTELYQKYAQELIEKGHAYYCFCTSEELDKMRAEQTAAKLAPMYDRRCLKLKPEEIKAKLEAKTPYVIRLKIPRDKKIEFVDHVRGRVTFLGNQIDDQVLIKSDGLPTYHLANVVDDHLMQISLVLRAEEWLPSTPKHLIMYEAFGWPIPEFAHPPLILNADKSKLSKRKNDVSVESYLAKGYLPEALINFIALLGWHPGKGSEQEIFSMQDLLKQFSLDNLHKSGAVFSLDKLNWLNNIWQKIKFFEKLDTEAQKLDSEVKIETTKNYDHLYQFTDPAKAPQLAQIRAQKLLELNPANLDNPHYQSDPAFFLRALTVNEEKILQNPTKSAELVNYFFEPKTLVPDLLINPKMGVTSPEQAKTALQFSQDLISALTEPLSIDKIKLNFLDQIKQNGHKNGEILWPLRAALTHEEFSVGAFEAIWVLGQAKSIKRLEEILK